MSDVKRYRLSYKYGVVSANGDLQHSPDCSEPMVRAHDYDALASRLAEAEQLAAEYRRQAEEQRGKVAEAERRVKELELVLVEAERILTRAINGETFHAGIELSEIRAALTTRSPT